VIECWLKKITISSKNARLISIFS
jgi:hypothetical protein